MNNELRSLRADIQPIKNSSNRPTASRQNFVHPKKVNYKLTWFYFMMVFCLLVAWFFPVKILVSYLLWPRVEQGKRDSYEFAALVYEGVANKEGLVTPYHFKQHIQHLKENGYSPVTLQDVKNMFENNEPLPEKAVLLTFDHSKKNSYFGVNGILRNAGWTGVMFLWTKPIEDKDQASIWWPYVRNMLRSKRWEIGAQSHDGFRKVVSSSKGKTGNFLTSPRWLDDDKRFESVDEFTRRLQDDHQTCLSVIKENTGSIPLAYAYPYGDFGQFNSRAALPRYLNMKIVDQYYALGFITGNLAMNTRYSDPRRLNRLLVQSEWSGEKLVDYLDRAWPQESPTLIHGDGAAPGAWIVDWGKMKKADDGGLVLYAPTNTTGAKMWLAGSDLSRDFHAQIKFRMLQGQLGIYLRSSPDEERFVYIGIDQAGGAWVKQMDEIDSRLETLPPASEAEIWLRQKEISSDRFTLASSHVPARRGKDHTLDVYLKDNLLFAILDQRPVFNQRVLLRGTQSPGMMGLSVWSAAPGKATVDITGVSLQNQEPMVACWKQEQAEDPRLFKWINDHAYSLTDISPDWITVSASGARTDSMHNFSTYRLLADINHLNLYPRVQIQHENGISRVAPSHLADKAQAAGADGVYLQLNNLDDINVPRLATWLQQCGQALKERGLDMLMQLPAVAETVTDAWSVLAVLPGVQLAVSSNSALLATNVISSDKLVETVEVPVDDKEVLPLFYMISHIEDAGAEESRLIRLRRLEQEGRAAYNDKEYSKALRAWSKWRLEDPENPQVYMLLGDVELAQDNLPRALEYYNKSLDIDPGQFSLVVRRAELLEKMGRSEEARESLNLYARLFPGNLQILMAQIDWLVRTGRRQEALKLAGRILEENPDNFEALALQLRFLTPDDPAYRNAMQQIADQLIDNPRPLYYGHIMQQNHLLSLPDSFALQQIANHTATSATDAVIVDLYSRLQFRENAERTSFSQSLLPDQWALAGGDYKSAPGSIELITAPGNAEVSLKLNGSMHYQNAFAEANVGEITGDFWLYARRSLGHHVRFGLSRKGMLYLQVWRNGTLLEQRTMPWEYTGEPVNLRLTVNNKGAMGYIDGKPVADGRLFVPSDISYGWFGAGVNTSGDPQASARLYSLAVGPLPLRAAHISADTDNTKQLEAIREHVSNLTVLAPSCSMPPGRTWHLKADYDQPLVRLFASYYRLWLLPCVSVQSVADINEEQVNLAAGSLKADGLILLLNQVPSVEELRRLNREFMFSSTRIILATRKGSQYRLTAVAGSYDIVNTLNGTLDLPVVPMDSLPTTTVDPLELKPVFAE